LPVSVRPWLERYVTEGARQGVAGFPLLVVPSLVLLLAVRQLGHLLGGP
jgi:hypothetical protein